MYEARDYFEGDTAKSVRLLSPIEKKISIPLASRNIEQSISVDTEFLNDFQAKQTPSQINQCVNTY